MFNKSRFHPERCCPASLSKWRHTFCICGLYGEKRGFQHVGYSCGNSLRSFFWPFFYPSATLEKPSKHGRLPGVLKDRPGFIFQRSRCWNERKGSDSSIPTCGRAGCWGRRGPGPPHQASVSLSAVVPLQNLIQQPLQKQSESALQQGCCGSVDKSWMCSAPVQLNRAAPALHSSSRHWYPPPFFASTICHNSSVGGADVLNGATALEHLLPSRPFCFIRNTSLKNGEQWDGWQFVIIFCCGL